MLVKTRKGVGGATRHEREAGSYSCTPFITKSARLCFVIGNERKLGSAGARPGKNSLFFFTATVAAVIGSLDVVS